METQIWGTEQEQTRIPKTGEEAYSADLYKKQHINEESSQIRAT